MLKQWLIALVAIVVVGVCSPAVAFDMTSDVPTAHSSRGFNKMLEFLNLELDPAKVDILPTSYAKIVDGRVMFNDTPIAYAPSAYHRIFVAYGLGLDPVDAINLTGGWDYCKVEKGRIIFGKTSTAYSNRGFVKILSSYHVVLPPDDDGDGVPNDVDECPNTPAGATVDDRGCWNINGTSLFEFNKSVIKSQYYPMLEDISRIMRNNPGMSITIDGHTDSWGPEAYNMGLSIRRAEAVEKYISSSGVDRNRLQVVGYGEVRPIATNKTAEGRSLNRRVELTPVW